MSVCKSLRLGCGMLIAEETVDKILETVSPEEHDELVESDYLEQIDSWCGGSYFLGITVDLGELEEPLLIEEIDFQTLIDENKVIDFAVWYSKQSWTKEIEWKPHRYLIKFIY